MGDGPEKTKIKLTSRNSSSSDKTRIAPVKKSASKPQVSDKNPQLKSPKDQTRIASSTKHRKLADGKSKISAESNANDRLIADTTRLKPEPSATVDKTRIAPTKNPDRDYPVSLEPPTEDSATQLGVLKNRFVLEKVLGAGGMGVVYKAKDLLKVEAQDRDPYVAIKVLNDEFKSHPEAFISLQRESRKSQRIAHPNIVNVYDFDRDNDTVFMTMEFLDGSPLDELINQYQSTGLPTEDAWDIIKGMTLALSHAHAEHIIHSDFKPGNVFVTKKGVAKVFDFGIARAVSKVEHLEDNPDDVTVFDAGNLGALTPAYASLEMLEGDEPDVRDDIYALGCVAYEMFTGQHPYNKVPADEAERQGLKPRRIGHIKKYQWRAIEKAIAFRRENRIESVEQFAAEVSPNLKTGNLWVTVSVFLLLAVGAGYYVYYQQQTARPQFSEFDIRNELELKIRIDFHKESILALIKDADFSKLWQDSIWKDISDLSTLTRGEDPWVDKNKLLIYDLYLKKIKKLVKVASFVKAEKLIENAKRYTQDVTKLDQLFNEIKVAVKKAKSRKKLVAQLSQKKKQDQQTQQLEKARKKQQVSEKNIQQQQLKQQFEIAFDNVNKQLKCQSRLNMRNFETAISKLKQLDKLRYDGLEKNIINSLAACITSVGKAFPERALEAKKHGLKLFNSAPVLSAVTIKSRDPCDRSLAGLGARGKRAICRDKLKAAGAGPELVVIPGNSKLVAFAIGKYEVSINELNKFCKNSTKCQPDSSQNGDKPVSNIRLGTARAYLKWMSSQTGQKYRLPTKKEWVYAAKSRRKSLDPNRNCELSTRGFQKGGELVKTQIGKQNSWGLVNYVGNVQEWVYDSGRKLTAVGGSFRQAMESCNVNTHHAHDGSADRATGFRVLRELRKNS